MNNKTTSQKKRVPQRTCVGCRIVQPKRSLIRIVSSPQSVSIDPTGKAPGRGAYLHDAPACWRMGLGGKLAQALKVEISGDDRAILTSYMESLPAEGQKENKTDPI